jgi:hypothetical protein
MSTFATVAGTAAATWLGLLFVAVPIRPTSSRIPGPEIARRRPALFVTALFITICFQSSAVLPRARRRLVGAPSRSRPSAPDRRADIDLTPRTPARTCSPILDAVPNATSVLLSPVCCWCSTFTGARRPCCPCRALAGGVTSAWLLLTKLPE